MANSQSSGEYKEYATVDTAPAAAGYWTNEIVLREKKVQHVFFSIRGTGVMTITLQFKCEGDSDWTDYDTYTAVTREKLVGNAARVQWRMGVKNGDRTSGSMTFGFDW